MFDEYFGPAIFAPWARVLLEYAAPKPVERVLDLACGTGTVARHVAPLVGANGRVVAVDVNPGMLAVARSHRAPAGAPIEWRAGDATSLDLPDGAFDLVLCQQGLQFFPERAAAVREMRRVMTDEGRVALNVWQALDRHPVYEALCRAEARHLDVPLSEVATPWSLPVAGELRTLLSEAGFQRIEVIAKSLEARFTSPERFVYLTLFAAAAFLPEFDWEDQATRTTLIEAVTREIEPVVQRYRSGDELIIPTSWHIALAYASYE
jgi:ubiquinone/menaquinone biosynthesis C-methylase UbiE